MKFPFLCTFSLLTACHVFSADWPKFGGLMGNFASSETGLRKIWDADEPVKVWHAEVGLGFSSVVEANGHAYTQGYSNGKNTIFCFQAETGKVVWKKQYPSPLGDNFFKGGSRATPVIKNENLYLLSHSGDFYSMNAKNGKINWSLNLIKDLRGIRPTWGYAGSPLVTDDSIVINTGALKSSLVALDPVDGEVLWRNGIYKASYSTPVKRQKYNQCLLFHGEGLTIHNLENGDELASYQHKTRYGINASQPLEIADRILVSSAYGKGSALVDFSSNSPKVLWKTEKVSSQIASQVLNEGFVFGIHGQAGSSSRFATLFCLDVEKGRVLWQKKGFGLGSVILVDKTLVVLSEEGELALVEANSVKYKELARFQILSGKENWIPPTFSNGRLYCRSSDGILVCLKMMK
ncbi:MAG: hypothetical protein CBC16_05760 [Verrucomicrobia bacterium TMED56]|jgi:outer membrane protein assembly factor BamB|nr:MAG: hypothetical protein CBC16_05760 [Verrucomicrobia bacterium TMED56]